MLITIRIVLGGIQGGIERASKILMPVLFGLLLLLVVRSLTLPGASEGLSFYLKPDFGKLDVVVILKAVSQAFFSLSLGMGAIITYGSYLSPKQDLVSSALYVSFFDFFHRVPGRLGHFPGTLFRPGPSARRRTGADLRGAPQHLQYHSPGKFIRSSVFHIVGHRRAHVRHLHVGGGRGIHH